MANPSLLAMTDGNCLREGDRVEYDAKYDEHKGKYRAENVTGGSKQVRLCVCTLQVFFVNIIGIG